VLLAVTFPLVGALVASRRPGNPPGWTFCVVGLTQGLVTVGWEYGTYALRTAPGTVPGGELASWLGAWAWAGGGGRLDGARPGAARPGRRGPVRGGGRRGQLLAVVDQTMQPSSASLWLPRP
jgi:hypothetical protein